MESGVQWRTAPDRVIAKVFSSLLGDAELPLETPCVLSERSLGNICDAYRFASTCRLFRRVCGSQLRGISFSVDNVCDLVSGSLDLMPLVPCIRLAGPALVKFTLTAILPDLEVLGGRELLVALAAYARNLEILRFTAGPHTPADGICYFESAFKRVDAMRLLGSLPVTMRSVEMFRLCPPSEFRSAVKQVAQCNCTDLEFVSFDAIEPGMSSFAELHACTPFWAGAPSKYLLGMLGKTLRRVNLSVDGDETGVSCRTLRSLPAKCPQVAFLDLAITEDACMRDIRGAIEDCLRGLGPGKLEQLTLGNLELSPKFCRNALNGSSSRICLRHCSFRKDSLLECVRSIESESSALVSFEGCLDDLDAISLAGVCGLETLNLVHYPYDQDVAAVEARAARAVKRLALQKLAQISISGSRNPTYLGAELSLLTCDKVLPLRSLELTRIRGLEGSQFGSMLRQYGSKLERLVISSCSDLSLTERARSISRYCFALRHASLWSVEERLSATESSLEFVNQILALCERNRPLMGKWNLLAAARALGSVTVTDRPQHRRKRLRRISLNSNRSGSD